MKGLKFTLFLFLIIVFDLSGQSISGIINNYTEVTATGINNVDVSNSSSFQIGDKVLIIQMKGASITTGNISDFGQINNQNNSGNFEFAIIASVNGLNISFENDLCHTYDVNASVQLVRVPIYTDALISGVLTAAPWDGVTGGILVLEATNSISFNSNINLKGMGFRGGQISTGGFSCNDPNWANANGGRKGEGIAEAPINQEENRAPLANGGGGSNTGNPGAGGGGNGGSGGRGGNEWFGSCALNVSYGIGGYPLDYSTYSAFMGGGGGGGYRDNGLNATDGANGGGIVFLISPLIEGNGHTIDVSGNDVIGNTDSEGAGGGGAGGCTYLVTQNLNSQLTINANGGKGGDIFSTLWQSACHGPGGGGGGGTTVLSLPNTPFFLNNNVSGGNSGSVLHNGPACAGTPHGATAGTGGQIIFDYELPVVTISPDLGADFVLCSGASAVLSLTETYSSYEWSDGSLSSELNISSPGIYWVEVPSSCGVSRDSIEVFESSALLDLGPNQEICENDQLTINIPPDFTFPIWSTGSTQSSITVDTQGQYFVDAVNIDGCLMSDTIIVNVVSSTFTSIADSSCQGIGYDFNGLMIYDSGIYIDTLLNIQGCDSIISLEYTAIDLPIFSMNDTIICIQDSIVLSLDTNYSYSWLSDNDLEIIDSNGVYIVIPEQSEVIQVIAQDINGCEYSINTEFTVEPLPLITINSNLTEICQGDEVELSVSGGFNYSWSGYGIQNPSAENQSIILNSSETYYVSGESDFGCIDSASIDILVNESPQLMITPDQEICPGDFAEIVVSGANYYEWQNSELNEISSPQVYVSPEQSLVYQVVGFNNLNCSDTIETTVFLYPSVQANFIVNPVLLTSDSPIINITNTSLNAVNSIWNYGDGLIEENNELFFDYQYAYTEGNYLLSLNVISEEGCIDSTQAVIQVKGGDLYYIPNSFTPDGDEFNNTFLPIFTVGFDPANYLCSIYNRWGELIFQSRNHEEGWNGQFNNSYCPDGLYTYVIKYKNPDLDEYKLVKGHVYLLR